MVIKKLTLKSADFPEVLRRIPSPPAQIYTAGAPLASLMEKPRVAVVGARGITPYGRYVTTELAARLAQQGVVIVSGLALGVDSTAHRAAIDAGGLCIAVLPSPLSNIVPIANRRLARRIIDMGGALVSEYKEGEVPFKQNFIARNRLVSGLAGAVLITEAAEKSGSLYTANFAIQQNKDVMAVPGNITAVNSVGTNNLLKQGSAAPVTSYRDVLNVLGLTDHRTPAKDVKGRNAREQTVLDLMMQGVSEGEHLLERSGLAVAEFNQVLTMLEIGGLVRPLGANQWAVS